MPFFWRVEQLSVQQFFCSPGEKADVSAIQNQLVPLLPLRVPAAMTIPPLTEAPLELKSAELQLLLGYSMEDSSGFHAVAGRWVMVNAKNTLIFQSLGKLFVNWLHYLSAHGLSQSRRNRKAKTVDSNHYQPGITAHVYHSSWWTTSRMRSLRGWEPRHDHHSSNKLAKQTGSVHKWCAPSSLVSYPINSNHLGMLGGYHRIWTQLRLQAPLASCGPIIAQKLIHNA